MLCFIHKIERGESEMAYFVRYTNNPEADLERGYSFVGYQLFATEEEVIKFHTGFGVDEDDIDICKDNVTGLLGWARNGLCGFGPYATIEEAKDRIINNPVDQYACMPAHIFDGTQTFEDGQQDDGLTFAPSAIIE